LLFKRNVGKIEVWFVKRNCADVYLLFQQNMDNQNNSQFNEPVQSSNNIWKIIISVIITALVIGGGVYAWQRFNLKSAEQNLQQQIENLQSQLNQFQQGQVNLNQQENINSQGSERSQGEQVNGLTADWKIYKNETYGFEFKYPNDWSYNGEESIIVGPNDIPLRVSVENEKNDYYFSVSIDKNWSTTNFYYDASTKEPVVIDKVKYTAYIFPYGYEVYEPEEGKDYSTFTIPIKRGDRYYIISGRGHAKNLADYNDILSTFKFTK